MRRLLASIGFSFLMVNFFAAYWPSAAYPLSAVVCIFGGLIALYLWRRWPQKSTLVYLAVFFICGGIALVHRGIYQNAVVRPIQQLAGQQAAITAEVQEVWYTQERDYAFVQAKVLSMDGQKVRPFSIRVGLPGGCEQGAQLTAQVLFELPDKDRYLTSSYAAGVYLNAVLQDANTFQWTPAGQDSWQVWKSNAISAVQRFLPGQNTALIAAITIGDDSLLDEQTETEMQKAGLSHLLVVSGLHLSAVSGMLYEGVRGYLPRKMAVLAACCGSLLFMMLVGFSPSVVRAGVMLLAFYAAKWLGEKEDAFTSLGLAALLLCLVNPYAACDVGLLLSFSATLGILAANILWQDWSFSHEACPQFLKGVFKVALASFGAVLATAPVLIWYDLGLSFYGLFANLLVAPFTVLTLASGLGTVLLSSISWLGALTYPVAFVCGICLGWVRLVAAAAAALPANTVRLSGAYPALALVGLFVVGWAAYQNRVSLKKSAMLLAVLFAGACAVLLWQNAGVVRVVFAGSAENAPVVLLHPKATVLFFRGGESGIAQVRDVLEQYQRTDIQLAVDLRKEPDGLPLQEALRIDELFTVETDCLQRASFEQLLPGLDLYLLRQENGCAALISCEGVRVALTSGSMDFSNMPAVEVFFGGSGKITQLQADTILFSAAPRSHWNNVSAQRKLQGEDIELWLHPNRGWSVKEGNAGVL